MPELEVEELANLQHEDATVLFHAPWCPHCVNFMPEFEKFCKKNDNCHTYDMAAKADVLKSTPQLQSTHMAIAGYPTVIMFSKQHNGGFVYNGPRNESSLQASLNALRSS